MIQEHGDNGRRGDSAAPSRPRTILVLGGGGMKGMAHIGVLKALERLRIPVDEVIGTSIGAVIGAMFAAGHGVPQLMEMVSDLSRKDYFRLNLLKFLTRGYRTVSLYQGANFHAFLKGHFQDSTFADLKLPFFCNALSLTTGAQRYFGLPGTDQVPVADAIYASSCLPGIFEPLAMGGDFLIDGGIAETLPLRLARARKADLILAVDLSIRDYGATRPWKPSLPHVLFRAFEIAEEALNEFNLHLHGGNDIVLMKPKVGHLGIFDFQQLDEIVALGEREALEMLSTHVLTRGLCDPEALRSAERLARHPRDHVHLDVDLNLCIHCGICAVTCATQGFAAVAQGDVVRKVQNYECTRDGACQRNCPTNAVRLTGL
jgi:NTE family protein